MLSRSNASLVRRSIAATAEGAGCQILAIGGRHDHVHVLLRIEATSRVSDIAHDLKGASSHLVTHSPDGDATFKWQGGYAAISVSPQNVPIVAAYIHNQAAHHRDGTTDSGWEVP
jgi:REP element-mobilizing transposase RayT